MMLTQYSIDFGKGAAAGSERTLTHVNCAASESELSKQLALLQYVDGDIWSSYSSSVPPNDKCLSSSLARALQARPDIVQLEYVHIPHVHY